MAAPLSVYHPTSTTSVRAIVALPVLTLRAHAMPRISHEADIVSGSTVAANNIHGDGFGEVSLSKVFVG